MAFPDKLSLILVISMNFMNFMNFIPAKFPKVQAVFSDLYELTLRFVLLRVVSQHQQSLKPTQVTNHPSLGRCPTLEFPDSLGCHCGLVRIYGFRPELSHGWDGLDPQPSKSACSQGCLRSEIIPP